MEKLNQRFTSFQSVMLKMKKYLVIKTVLPVSNQQQSNLLYPSPHDMIHTQPPAYPYHLVFIHHLYSPHKTPHSPLTHISLPSSPPNTPSVHIPPQPPQGTTPPPNQMLPQSL